MKKFISLILGVSMIFAFAVVARGAETTDVDIDELIPLTFETTVTVTRAETYYIKNVGTQNRLYFVYGEDKAGYIDVGAYTYAKTKDGDTLHLWCYNYELENSVGTWKMYPVPTTEVYVSALYEADNDAYAYAELSDGSLVKISRNPLPYLMQDVELKNGVIKGYEPRKGVANKIMTGILFALMVLAVIAVASLILIPLGMWIWDIITTVIENRRDRKWAAAHPEPDYDDWYSDY